MVKNTKLGNLQTVEISDNPYEKNVVIVTLTFENGVVSLIRPFWLKEDFYERKLKNCTHCNRLNTSSEGIFDLSVLSRGRPFPSIIYNHFGVAEPATSEYYKNVKKLINQIEEKHVVGKKSTEYYDAHDKW